MQRPQFRDDGAVRITLGGQVHWLSREAVMESTFRVEPSEPIQAVRGHRTHWVTIRRKAYPVNQVVRLALGLRGRVNTAQAVPALRHLGFRVEERDPQ